jgi:hypothetical protein
MPAIKPNEVVAQKKKDIPEEVLECWNTLIAKHFSDGDATVYQGEAVTVIAEKMGVDKDKVFDNHWLDIEDIYRAAGWSVVYDKPIAWGGDNYEAHFIFKKKRKR